MCYAGHSSISASSLVYLLHKLSLRFTTNDLIRHQQVVTEAEKGKRAAFDFLTAAERRSGGMHQLQTMTLYPPPVTYTHTHSLTNKTQTLAYTHTNFRALVFPLTSWTTGSLSECGAALRVFLFVCKQLSDSKQNYHHLFS